MKSLLISKISSGVLGGGGGGGDPMFGAGYPRAPPLLYESLALPYMDPMMVLCMDPMMVVEHSLPYIPYHSCLLLLFCPTLLACVLAHLFLFGRHDELVYLHEWTVRPLHTAPVQEGLAKGI